MGAQLGGPSVCAARLTRTEINVYVEGKLGIALKDTELQRRGMELSKANDRGQWHYVAETEYQAATADVVGG